MITNSKVPKSLQKNALRLSSGHGNDTNADTIREISCLDERESVHHSKIHTEKFNKMQQCIKILLFHIYIKLNMFRATHRPSSGA
jgi:hypothetical protein